MPIKNLLNDTEKTPIDLIGSEITRVEMVSELKRSNHKIIVLENPKLNSSEYYHLPDENNSTPYALIGQDSNNKYSYDLSLLVTKRIELFLNGKISLDSIELAKSELSIRLASQVELKKIKIALQENKAEFKHSYLSRDEIDDLFKKLIKGEFQLLVYPENIHSYDIAQLISKNKTIPELLKTLTPERPDIAKLKRAIEEADFSSPIWNNQDCNVYLLYLMNQQLISFNAGITAYMYLIALMQLTPRQALQAKDGKQVKKGYPVSMKPMVTGGKLTILGEGYADLLASFFSRTNLDRKSEIQEVKDYILSLPFIEQHLIHSQYDQNFKDPNSDIEKFLNDLISNLPIPTTSRPKNIKDNTAISSSCSSSLVEYSVPSFSLIQFILNKINPETVKLVPIFGNMGLDKLYQWHKSGFHPFNLFAPQVKSNQPWKIDGYLSGPWPALLHDIFHAQSMNLLSTKERQRIFEQFIPVVGLLQELDFKFNSVSFVEDFTHITEGLYDFNLSPASAYFDQHLAFNRYLRFSFTNLSPEFSLDRNMLYSKKPNNEPIGSFGDLNYFCLQFIRYDNTYAANRDTVFFILDSVDKDTAKLRDSRILRALRTVAENFVKNPNQLITDQKALESCQVNWIKWLELIKSTNDSEALWTRVIKDSKRYSELLDMMSNGLIFLDPYIPMTEAKKNEFKEFLFVSLKNSKIEYILACLSERESDDILKDLDKNGVYFADRIEAKTLYNEIDSRTPDYQVVKLLLKYSGADVNAKVNCDTALYSAAEWGHEQIVELLLKQPSIGVNTRCGWGKTALHIAAQCGREQVVKILLLDKRVDPFIESCGLGTPETPLDTVVHKMGLRKEDIEQQKRLLNIAKILIKALVSIPDISKPDILKGNSELSNYWDSTSKAFNDQPSNSSTISFFRNKQSDSTVGAENKKENKSRSFCHLM